MGVSLNGYTKYGMKRMKRAQDMLNVKGKKIKNSPAQILSGLLLALSFFFVSAPAECQVEAPLLNDDGPLYQQVLGPGERLQGKDVKSVAVCEREMVVRGGDDAQGASAVEDGPERLAVFVYGTLRFALVRRLVMGEAGSPERAVLPGYRRRLLNIIPAEDEEVHGLLLMVTPSQLAALDRYERLGVRYLRHCMELADGSLAWVYRRVKREERE